MKEDLKPYKLAQQLRQTVDRLVELASQCMEVDVMHWDEESLVTA